MTPPPLQNCACDFHRTRLLSIRAVVTSATTNNHHGLSSVQVEWQSFGYTLRFSVRQRRLSHLHLRCKCRCKTRHPSIAEGFPYTLPTSAYTAPAVRRRCPSAFPKAFACFDRLNTSLGRSLLFGLVVGCLLHRWRASSGLLCSAYPFRPCFVYGRMNSIVSSSSVTRLSNLDPSNPFCLNFNMIPI